MFKKQKTYESITRNMPKMITELDEYSHEKAADIDALEIALEVAKSERRKAVKMVNKLVEIFE